MARNRLVWLVCLSILSVVPAGATFQTYTDLALWQQVTTLSATVIDFSSLGVIPGQQSTSSLSLVIDGVTFTSPTPTEGKLLVVNASSGQPWYNWGTASILRPENDGWPVKTTWTPSFTAFAALMGITKMEGGVPVTSQMDVTVRNGGTIVWQQTLVTSARPTLTFFGIVATEGETFDSVTFQPAEGTSTTAFLDDVRLGEAAVSETPELGTGLLSLCGGILLAAGGFRRHVKPS